MDEINDMDDVLRLQRQIYLLIKQDKIWLPNGKPAVRISDMDPEWRHNTAAFLERNASGYLANYTFGEYLSVFHTSVPTVITEENGQPVYGEPANIGPSPGSTAEDAAMAELEQTSEKRNTDPAAWIRSTPLYRAIVAGLPEGEEREALAARARHWNTCPARTDLAAACECPSRKEDA